MGQVVSMVSMGHGNISLMQHYASSGLADSHMEVPDAVCADMLERIMLLQELNENLRHRGGVPANGGKNAFIPAGR